MQELKKTGAAGRSKRKMHEAQRSRPLDTVELVISVLTGRNATGSRAPATCWPSATRRWCCNDTTDNRRDVCSYSGTAGTGHDPGRDRRDIRRQTRLAEGALLAARHL